MNQEPPTAEASQRAAFERIYGVDPDPWWFHDTPNPLVRYLRDRRLHLALAALRRQGGLELASASALVVCGGVGGEASFLRKAGLGSVTNSDFSESALELCRRRDPQLQTLQLDAQAIDLPDAAFDLVLVQDGLHHLPRPVSGFNEMLRVARRAVVVIEPHDGWAGRLLGTEWERHHGAVNYVFRWNRRLLEQATRSQLLEDGSLVQALRLWDHSGRVHGLVKPLGDGALSLAAARAFYALLGLARSAGNSFIGIVVKQASGPR